MTAVTAFSKPSASSSSISSANFSTLFASARGRLAAAVQIALLEGRADVAGAAFQLVRLLALEATAPRAASIAASTPSSAARARSATDRVGTGVGEGEGEGDGRRGGLAEAMGWDWPTGSSWPLRRPGRPVSPRRPLASARRGDDRGRRRLAAATRLRPHGTRPRRAEPRTAVTGPAAAGRPVCGPGRRNRHGRGRRVRVCGAGATAAAPAMRSRPAPAAERRGQRPTPNDSASGPLAGIDGRAPPRSARRTRCPGPARPRRRAAPGAIPRPRAPRRSSPGAASSPSARRTRQRRGHRCRSARPPGPPARTSGAR